VDHAAQDFFAVRKSTDGNVFLDFGVSLVESFSDSNVTSSVSGNTYWYAVAGVNAAGTSSFSNTASILFQDLPLAPSNLQVSSGSALLTWDSGSTGQDYFALQRSIDGLSYSDFAAPVADSYTDSTVTGSYTGVSYWYRVAAVDEVGTSSFSNTASIIFQFPPEPPLLLPITSGSAILSWITQSTVCDFIVLWRSTDGNHYDYLDLTNATASNYTDPNVTCSLDGQTYWYKVHAVVDGPLPLSSSLSDSQSITFTCPPAAPLLLPIASGSAIVTWVSQSNIVDYFNLWRSFVGTPGTYDYLNQVSFSGSSYTDTDVTCSVGGQSYWYAVDAVNAYGTSSLSNTQSITFTCTNPTPPPEAPLFLMVTSGSAILDWTTGSNASYYNVYKTLGDVSGSYNVIGTASLNHYVDHDVTASNTYWYKVTGVGEGGESSASNPASIVTLPCNSASFQPIVVSGYVPYASGSTYKNIYGVLVPFTTSVSQSISVWARSPDFVTEITLVDANGTELANNKYDGWVPSGDKANGNSAIAYTCPSGSYQIEVSSFDNRAGRYYLYISPGAQLEVSWSPSVEPTDCFYVPTSKMVVVGESGRMLVFWDTVNNTSSIIDYTAGIQGACYSPTQDKIYAWCYYLTAGKYTASLDEYDNTGSLVYNNYFFRNPYDPFPTIDFSGYLSYDEYNDRILFARYNYSTTYNVAIWDCATRTVVAALSSSAYQSGSGLWMSCYSNINNCYYLANQNLRSMVKIDATNFSMSNTAVQAAIVVSYISSSNLMMIRGAGSPGKVSFYNPVTDTLVYTRSDLPSVGLFEGGSAGSDCINVFAAGIDPKFNDLNVPAIALLDKNTYILQNYLAMTQDGIDNSPFASTGFYGYALTFDKDNSRIYSAQQTYDGPTEGRLYSILPSRATVVPISPYQATSADTASCITYQTNFPVTTSLISGNALPRYIAVNSNSSSIVVSDNESVNDDNLQHNRHNWFFSMDGTLLTDYTASYVHTWAGKNAVVCNNKYYMLDDGLYGQTGSAAMSASSLLVFDHSGSLIKTVALTGSAMDLSATPEDVIVYGYGLNRSASIEVISGSDESKTQHWIQNVNWSPFFFFNAKVSTTASMANPLGYYQGKVFACFDDGGTELIFVNNLETGSISRSGEGDIITRVYGYQTPYNYYLSMEPGVSPYNGWAGSLAYCVLTDTVFVGAYTGSAPVLIETNIQMATLRTYDLSAWTASNFTAIHDIVYNPKSRALEMLCQTTGRILIFDPVARTFVCAKDALGDAPTGSLAGDSLGINTRNGDTYFPQRYDGYGVSATGSIKIYTK
jgi:fibronectin type 3 domain-containing protein